MVQNVFPTEGNQMSNPLDPSDSMAHDGALWLNSSSKVVPKWRIVRSGGATVTGRGKSLLVGTMPVRN